MPSPNTSDKGWALANCWLAALEEAARDFLGTNPRAFCERGYEHATVRWIQVLEELYGITTRKASSVKEAIENYIQVGVEAGFFRDPSQFEISLVNPHRVEIKVLECPYRRACEQLLESGFSIRDLTCARIGCFRAAAEHLSGIPCQYEVTGFWAHGDCEGYIVHR